MSYCRCGSPPWKPDVACSGFYLRLASHTATASTVARRACGMACSASSTSSKAGLARQAPRVREKRTRKARSAVARRSMFHFKQSRGEQEKRTRKSLPAVRVAPRPLPLRLPLPAGACSAAFTSPPRKACSLQPTPPFNAHHACRCHNASRGEFRKRRGLSHLATRHAQPRQGRWPPRSQPWRQREKRTPTSTMGYCLPRLPFASLTSALPFGE